MTDTRHRHRLIALDLDSSRLGSAAVAEDLRRVRGWLTEAGIHHVVACSGPDGGRHVWFSIPQGAPAALVARFARALRTLLPTLDHGVLLNAKTGAVRPPGALHRSGGHSRLDPAVHGNGGVVTASQTRRAARLLRRHGTTCADLEYLLRSLPTLDTGTTAEIAAPRSHVLTDAENVPYLAGQPRALSTAAAATLHAPLSPTADRSAVLWSVLLAAAVARYRLSDVRAWIADPGAHAMEHARSQRCPGEPHPRPRTVVEQETLLRRQWERAVDTASRLPSSERRTGREDLHARIEEITTVVAGVLAQAAQLPERWAGPGGPADHAVLQALCWMCLRSRQLEVDLDVRRWAEIAGHSRSTVSRAVARLASLDDGGHQWLELVAPSRGTRAARWRLVRAHTASLSAVDTGGTQGEPAPGFDAVCRAGGGVAVPARAQELSGDMSTLVTEMIVYEIRVAGDDVQLHKRMIAEIAAELAHTRDDVWTYRTGLGHHLSRVLWTIQRGASNEDHVAQLTGYSRERIASYLGKLRAEGLVSGVCRLRRMGSLRTVAHRLGVLGAAAQRAHEHLIDRELAAWWRDELVWRNRRGKRKPGASRAAPATQLHLAVGARPAPRTKFGPFPA
ncbi:LOW QUALITY PROTEIN: LigA protein, partial [Kutzneria sp. 744]